MTRRVRDADLDEILDADFVPWADLAGKTVLVTGASGMLAAYLVGTMLRRNDRAGGPPTTVVGLVRNAERAALAFGDWLDRDDLSLCVQDVSAPLAYEGPVDVIVHAASQASPRFYGVDPVGTLSANTLGLRHLLDKARETPGCRLLFVSSAEVYGALPSEQAASITEDSFGRLDPATVRACYGESKRMGEAMCAAWNHQHGVHTTMVRPFHTYAPTMSLEDGRVFADFVANVVRGEPIRMNSDGTARRAFCYVTDATTAMFAVLLKGEAATAYNLGNPEQEFSMRELAAAIVALRPELGLEVHAKPIDKDGYIASAVSRVCPNVDRLAGLGWRPTVDVHTGFDRVLKGHGA